MDKLYNTVMGAYAGNFSGLSAKSQLHFASRLYLWQQEPAAVTWLQQLRPGFTAHDQPLTAAKQLVNQPSGALHQTGSLRAPYFARYPKLRDYERVLFRLLFVHTLYGLDTREIFDTLFDQADTEHLCEALLNDTEGLSRLSSFGINYLYLLERFVHQDDTALPLDHLLHVGKTAFGRTEPECRLQCYFYTHCVIGESLFYARPIPPQHIEFYRSMLAAAEELIDRSFAKLKLDNLYEFLVCCRILGHQSSLEERILRASHAALSPDGFLAEPTDARPPDLNRAEHRNVLFLMSQRPYQPLISA